MFMIHYLYYLKIYLITFLVSIEINFIKNVEYITIGSLLGIAFEKYLIIFLIFILFQLHS